MGEIREFQEGFVVLGSQVGVTPRVGVPGGDARGVLFKLLFRERKVILWFRVSVRQLNN
jgi:hypothetical protein